LVLPYIEMNPPQVYMCSPSWTLLPPPLPIPSLWVVPLHQPQASSIAHRTWTGNRFIYDIIHISVLFSQIIPPSPSPTESKRLFYKSVFLLLSRIQGYCYHLSKFHVYVLVYCIGVFLFFLNFILFLNFTILYWFCQISKWIHHRYTCVPHPEPSSLLPPHTIPLGRPSAPAPSIQYHASNLDWWLISYMILYIFQCHSAKSSHPLPLPQSPKDCSIHQCLFCCLLYRVIGTIFLNSIYIH